MNLFAINQTQTMSSRELLAMVNEVRKSHGEKEVRINDFNSRIEDELDGDHYETFVVQNSNKTETKLFNLTIDQCVLVAMRESKMVRRVIRDKLKSMGESQPKMPQSKLEWIEFALQQEKLLIEQAPKVLFHDTVNQADQTHKLQEAGKKLQQRPNKFCEWLRVNGYTDSKNVPYQRWINQGLFKVHTGVTDQGREYTQGRITGKGLAYFAGKLVEIKL